MSMPFAFMVALATFAGILVSREKKEILWTRETWLLLIFTGWMFVSTLFAWYPGLAWPQWDKVWRIMLMTYLTLMLIRDKDRSALAGGCRDCLLRWRSTESRAESSCQPAAVGTTCGAQEAPSS